MAQVVYARTAADSAVRGDLFEGLKFFIAQRCPSRTTYVDKVTSNGGQLVKLETQADLLIADDISRKTHLNPPGSISYKFIDDSLRRGILADAEDEKYQAGPSAGAIRPVSSIQPSKFGRTPFTLEEKIQLFEFVESFAKQGGSVRGNEIYKQLERINPRHTFQAWRDHYIKKLEGRPHPGNGNVSVQQTAPPTPPIDQHSDPLQSASGRELPEPPPPRRAPPMTTAQARRYRQDPIPAPPPQPVLKAPGFTADDIHDLLVNAEDILDTRVRHEAAAWQAWVNLVADAAEPDAQAFSPSEWKLFWQRIVYPLYQEFEDDKRRTKIYNMSWLAWSDMNKGATADEWLEYFDLVVKPLLHGDELGKGDTPVKQGSSQIFGGHANRLQLKDGGVTGPDGLDPQRKRPSPQPEAEHNGNKRQRLQPPETELQSAASHGEIDHDEETDASMRAFVNLSDDELQAEVNRPSMSGPVRSAASQVPPSSPPRAAGPSKRAAPAAYDTQAILQHTQDIDFDVPEPEGGFNDEVLYPDLQAHESLTSSQSDPLGHELAASAETQMAENVIYHDEVAESATATGRTTDSSGRVAQRAKPAPAHLAMQEADYPALEERAAMLNIEALVEGGHDPSMIQEAALRTSADPTLFRVVLRSLEHGRGVPARTRGVWTHEDDETVQGTDARALQRLEAKHGNVGLHSLEGRLDFLREWMID